MTPDQVVAFLDSPEGKAVAERMARARWFDLR